MKNNNKILAYFIRNFEHNTTHLTEAQKKTKISYGVLLLNMLAVLLLAVLSAIYIKSLFIGLLIQLPLFIFFHYNLKRHSKYLKMQKKSNEREIN